MQLHCGRKSVKEVKKNAVQAAWRETLSEYLKKEGLRSTGQREKVAEIAFHHGSHFEIQTLAREVQLIYPEISPATVYRSVKTLCDAGLLNETLQSKTGVTLYETTDAEHHDHVVCMDCGEIFEFHDEGMESAQEKAVAKLHFEPLSHKHVIYAKCGLLAEQKNNSKK